LLQLTEKGLYCAAGDFYIDPWQPVARAIITHAHADHARVGSDHYLTAKPGDAILRIRLGKKALIQALAYGETINIHNVRISLHPAGHILGSAQVRLEYKGEVWAVSGDYKWELDPTCAPFEVIPCHTFITESTFGIPIYRWPNQYQVYEQLHAWWQHNQLQNKTSVVLAYALGKAQRILAHLDPSIGPIHVHDTIRRLLPAYAESGVSLPATRTSHRLSPASLILAPPSTRAMWQSNPAKFAVSFASGWMLLDKACQKFSVEQGFVLSDHADWLGLLKAIYATGAEQILVTHGNARPLVNYLQKQGMAAKELTTQPLELLKHS
jgi:putative mRNA 3-end processing factor